MAVVRTPNWTLRARVIAGSAVLALLPRLFAPAPPPATIEGVANLLGQSIEGTVRVGDFRWEKSNGLLIDTLFGRGVVFLGLAKQTEARDVFRTRVKLSLEGRPIATTGPVFNLTNTPLGDDSALTSDGPTIDRFVAFTSLSFGAVTGVTVLDLNGDGGVVGATSVVDHFLGHLTNVQETGSWAGLGRTEISIGTPPESLAMRFEQGPSLAITTPKYSEKIALPRPSYEAAEQSELVIAALPHLRKAPILWAVDSVRAVVGPGPIAWLEETFFGARDRVRRASHAAFSETQPVAKVANEEAPPPSPPLDASAAGEDGGYWPPSNLPSIWKTPDAKEGVWEAATYPFLKKMPGAVGAPPSYFMRTYLKPDAQRPYTKVLVVAMDTRQVEVNMEGGVEDPKPLTGAKGVGRIPRDPDILSRVVGAFNGAFKTTHGAYGMMVNKRVLLPPKVEGASVLVTDDHRVGMGTWRRAESDIPHNIVAFRQNLDPLVEDGVFNPKGRVQWGFQLAGTSVMTERSGICITKAGHFFYLWGDDVSGTTLGKAMVQAGCQYGMHLDMNPKHTGFVFADIRDVHKKQYDAKLLSDGMEIQPERYIEWSPKDFFYVMLRDTTSWRNATKIKWVTDKGTQPAPQWLPAINEAAFQAANTQVRLLTVDADRSTFRIKPGRGESDLQTDLSEEESHRVLIALAVGTATKGQRSFGARIEGKTVQPFRGQAGYVAVDSNGSLTIAETAPSEDKAPTAVELPLIVANSKLTFAADERGPARPRAAICVNKEGRMIWATSQSENDRANAEALIEAGCTSVVALDRGGHTDTWIQRAGVQGATVARGEQMTLYVVASPLRPRGFLWK